MDINKIFADIYKNNKWKCDESKSGPGSKLSVNLKLLKLMDEFIKLNNVKIINDCGCGDFNWMKHFNFNSIEQYTGFDIVEELIDENNTNYSSEKINFKCISIIDDFIPYSDLLICKDVLFHLSFEDALKALSNFKNSKSKFLLSTTFTDFKNQDILSGDWRPINLKIAPFNLGEPILYWENIEDRNDSLSNKSIGIWKLNG